MYCKFQIVTPQAGCDEVPGATLTVKDISIHAPQAGCDFAVDEEHMFIQISIHAPQAGCDVAYCLQSPKHARHFNPRTPSGVRRVPPTEGRDWNDISIHAPQAGCDSKNRKIYN